MLGTGSGALLVYFVKPLDKDKLARLQVLLLASMSIAVIVSIWGLLQIEFVPQKIDTPAALGQESLSFLQRVMIFERNPELFKTWKLYGAIPLAFLPFFIGGYVQALIFRSAPSNFGLLYGFDLIGATFGSIAIPLLLYPLGLRGTAFLTALAAVLPVLYAFARRRTLRLAAAALAPVLVYTGLWASGSFQIKYAAGFSEKDLIRELWSPMSRVALMNNRGQEMYVIDNGSRTMYVPKNERNVRRYLYSLYTIPFEMKKGGDLLVIASGGGQELTMGSHFGMKRIDAVEIARPIVTDILENRRDEPGNPYLLPNVNAHIADGRSVIMRSKHHYDVIQMLDVNFATLAGQMSLAWSPNFISTQEAFCEYFDHLKEDGYLCYTLFSYSRNPLAGEKGRRVVSLAAGMKAAGIAHPQNHLMILSRPSQYGYQTMFLAKKTPFSPEERLAIVRIAVSRAARVRVLYPDLENMQENGPESIGLKQYLQRIEALCRETQPIYGLMSTLGLPNQLRIPLNDDRPYLVGSGMRSDDSRFESLIGGLYKPLLKILAILGFFFLLLPFLVRRPGGGERVRIDPRLVLILVFTGIGFMFLEMAGIYRFQLYLHHPTLAMIVVLSSMILGAGLGSLHSGKIPHLRKEIHLPFYSGSASLGSIALFLAVPSWGHAFLLWLPMTALLPLIFLAFAALGFLLGHVVPLSIDSYGRGQANLLPWSWAITVTGSVIGTVLASILARDYGMFLVSALGVLSYFAVTVVNLIGKALAPSPSKAPQIETGSST